MEHPVRPRRALLVAGLLVVVVAAGSGCALFHRDGGPAVTGGAAVHEQNVPSGTGPAAGPVAGDVDGTAARAGELVVAMIFARDREERLARARELLALQAELPAPGGKADPAARAARAWLEEWLHPADERQRRQGRIGPRIGVRDIWHAPGYEVWIEAGDGLLVLGRDGRLLGRIAPPGGGTLHGVAFHDVDDDGQDEVFLEIDSGVNSGNRYVEITGWKEVGGAFRQVLARRLHATAFRWLDAGLGARLALVRLSGRPYLVIDPENEPEFLRWDEDRTGFVTEAAPARRARVF